MVSSLQKNKMKRIGELLSQDLSYIYGENECGPNGIKAEFLKISVAFSKRLAKDLGFMDYKVNKNPAGIACSGTVSLYGIWSKENGVMIEITQPTVGQALLYRTINGLRDVSGGVNQWISLSVFESGDYEGLCQQLLALYSKGASDHVA